MHVTTGLISREAVVTRNCFFGPQNGRRARTEAPHSQTPQGHKLTLFLRGAQHYKYIHLYANGTELTRTKNCPNQLDDKRLEQAKIRMAEATCRHRRFVQPSHR